MKMITSTAMTQGLRQYMEDTISIEQIGNDYKSLHIFDGHGGAEVSNMCKSKMLNNLNIQLKLNPDTDIAIRKTYTILDSMTQNKCIPINCGSTAVSAIFKDDMIWFANCGDSEAIVVFKNNDVRLVTECHKVEDEKERLIALGANITYDDACARINRQLNVARSIGDNHLKHFVISKPHIVSIKDNNTIDYVVMASDGLWDVVTPHELRDFIQFKRNGMQLEHKKETLIDNLTLEIVQMALNKGSTDNITIIMCMRK